MNGIVKLVLMLVLLLLALSSAFSLLMMAGVDVWMIISGWHPVAASIASAVSGAYASLSTFVMGLSMSITQWMVDIAGLVIGLLGLKIMMGGDE